MSIALVNFRDDFRIKDNPALFEAAKNYDQIIPFFNFDENYQGRKIGAAAKVFLHHCLESFDKLLQKEYGVKLILAKGDLCQNLEKIIVKNKVEAIYFNESYIAKEVEVEEKIRQKFSKIKVESFRGKILFDPCQIKTGQGEAFKVFTPFSKECLRQSELVGKFLGKAEKFSTVKELASCKLSELELLPPKNEGNWDEKLIENWEFDYEKIAQNTSEFLQKKLTNYKDDRNMLDKKGNSTLSPYFRFGMISPRVVFGAAQNYENHQQFVAEILWREFAYHVAFRNPKIAQKELKQKYCGFEWFDDAKDFDAWKKGKTGFDVVDAGMKEIYETGFMHGRARMIVASFLIKDLLIDWKKGEQYFFDCLVDADAAVNPFSWQWVFGSGLDAAPYFRIFNPELQQKRFDPQKKYCRKWLGDRAIIAKIVDHSKRRDIVMQKYKALVG